MTAKPEGLLQGVCLPLTLGGGVDEGDGGGKICDKQRYI